MKFLNIDDNMNPLVIDQHLCGQIAKEYNLSHDINIKAFNRKFNNLNRERNYDHSDLRRYLNNGFIFNNNPCL